MQSVRPFTLLRRNLLQSGKTSLGRSCVATITDEMHRDLTLWLRCVYAKQQESLDFTVNRFFVKLFKTSDINIVNECRTFLDLSYLAY